jgi:predicted nucleotidyltransferase
MMRPPEMGRNVYSSVALCGTAAALLDVARTGPHISPCIRATAWAENGKMKTLDEVITKLRHLQPELRRRYPIRELGIFGSYVRGQQTEDSDLDVLVDLSDDIGLLQLAGLQQDLSEALGLKVDLVMRDAVKRGLAARILSEAVML